MNSKCIDNLEHVQALFKLFWVPDTEVTLSFLIMVNLFLIKIAQLLCGWPGGHVRLFVHSTLEMSVPLDLTLFT